MIAQSERLWRMFSLNKTVSYCCFVLLYWKFIPDHALNVFGRGDFFWKPVLSGSMQGGPLAVINGVISPLCMPPPKKNGNNWGSFTLLIISLHFEHVFFWGPPGVAFFQHFSVATLLGLECPNPSNCSRMMCADNYYDADGSWAP